jgi:uncharacterized membrane protein YfcA
MPHFIFHFNASTIILLIVIATSAGLVDTLAGGGSLISVPALLTMGLPPVLALGTSKFQSCIGELNATIHFIRSKKVNFKLLLPGLFFAAVGSIFGTGLIQMMNNASAEKIIPWLLLGIVAYTYLSPYFLAEKADRKISSALFFIVFGLCLGFYNGFLGPGTGALWVFVFMFFLGFNLVSASMHAKPLNMTGSFFSLIVFMIGHHVIYAIGMIMAIGQLIGSRIGAHFVLEKGMTLVRPFYLFIITVMTLSLFVKMY